MEKTLFIIKPCAVAAGDIGPILSQIEKAGLRIVAMRMLQLSTEQAEGFYAVHRERPFFRELVEFMVSGPVVVGVLEGEDAIRSYRELMGATDPAKAEPGTLRARFATSLTKNAVHGSDGVDTAAVEISYFFRTLEVVTRV
jgi:nucleoside-diphosphate kinase